MKESFEKEACAYPYQQVFDGIPIQKNAPALHDM